MTAGQLTQRLNLTTGAVTNLIDRLEQRGAVKRMPDPNDRRKVIVTVNPDSLETLGQAYRSMGHAIEQLLAGYSLRELRFLLRCHQSVIEITKREIAALGKQF